MAEFHFSKYKTVDGNKFCTVLEIFTKEWINNDKGCLKRDLGEVDKIYSKT